MPVTRHDKLNPDRRAHRRYPVSVNVNYTVVLPGGRVQTGSGVTLNLSEKGILFQAETVVPAKARIEFSIPWPMGSEDEVQLELHGRGETTRVDGERVAVRVKSSLFQILNEPTQTTINVDG